MSKIIYISIKAVILICSTWMVAPLAQMIDQFNPSTPPLAIYYIFHLLIFSHETLLLVKPVRKIVLSGFSSDGVLDVKHLLAVWFSLICIRIFAHGKLNEVYYPGSGYDSVTYYYLVLIIMFVIGGSAATKIISSIFIRNTK